MRRRVAAVVVAALILGVSAIVWNVTFRSTSSGANTSFSCSQGTPAQQATCNGHPTAPTIPPLPSIVESPWVNYGSQFTLPNSSIVFASTSNGWLVSGLGGGPGIDDNLSTGPGGTTSPGTSVEMTTDGGSTWRTVLTSATGVWGIDALTTTDVWAVGVGYLYASSDGGNTWTTLYNSVPADSALIAVSFTSPTSGIGLTASGNIEETSDGGATWSPINGLPTISGNASSICSIGNTFLVSTRSGAVWVASTGTSPSSWSNTLSPQSADVGIVTISSLACDASTGSAQLTVEPVDIQSSGGQVVVSTLSSRELNPNIASRSLAWRSFEFGGSSKGATISKLTVVPVSGLLATPFMFGSGDSSQAGVFTLSSQGELVHSDASGTLLGSSANSFVVLHGAAFAGPSEGWVYANVTPLNETSSNGVSSNISTIIRTTDGGKTWTVLSRTQSAQS